MSCYIFTDGDTKGALLHLALDDLATQHAFEISVHYSANEARPAARKARLLYDSPVVLVIDAETSNLEAAREREWDWRDYLGFGDENPFKLIQFFPESEVVFFEVPGLLEQVLGRPVDPLLLAVGEAAPKKAMSVLGTSIEQIAASPVEVAVLRRLREHPQLAELREFVRASAPQFSE
jgi:hypothetical protein